MSAPDCPAAAGGRIEAVSDGVVAIAMTMLGLALKAPAGGGHDVAIDREADA